MQTLFLLKVMKKSPKIGTVVRLKSTENSPLGGWMHDELATVCSGTGLESGSILVRLHDRHLNNVIDQYLETSKGMLAVNLENIVEE